MSLTPGNRIGAFQVVGVLGAGGMGEVYRARDLKLGREVAIKILPAAFQSDPDRLARFEREARSLAAINHPNIAAIYGVEEQPGINALVLELVEGHTLEERLRSGPIPIREAVDIARQTAAALNAAHEKEIVHRDLKPANIKITPGGVVKILDFGLAKAAEELAASAPAQSTMTAAATQAGVVLGTPAYMSPEQARGQAVDKRTDIWSFGCLLFEMLTGRQPFAGATMSDSIAAILDRDPDWTALPAATPPSVRRLLQRCLTKDSRQRLRDIGEVPFALDDDGAHVAKRSQRSLVMAFAALIACVGLAAVFFVRQRYSYPVVVAPPVRLTDFNDSTIAPSLSPDGRMLTFIRGGAFGDSAARGQVYVKLLPAGEPVQLTRDQFIKEQPVFTPDGSRIVYTAVTQRWKWDSWQVPVLGGAPQPFLPNASGLVWLDERQLMYAEMTTGVHMGIVTSTESRSEHRRIYFPSGENGMAHRSVLSPDRKSLLIVEMDGGAWLPCRLMPFDASTTGRPVGPPNAQCTTAAWSPDGAWMYFSSNAETGFHIWRQRFPDGVPEQVTFGPTEQEGTVVTADGKYLITSMGTQLATVWLRDSAGERQLTSETYALLPTLAPSGDRVYYLARNAGARAYAGGELWSVSLATEQRERELPGRVMGNYSLSADGRKVVFTTAEDEADRGIWIAELGRRTPPRRLTKSGEFRAFFGAPGEIVYLTQESVRFLYRMKEDGSENQRISTTPVTNLISVSPDGRWAVALLPRPEQNGGGTQGALVSLHGEASFPLCADDCAIGFGPNRVQAPLVNWSADGTSLYVGLQYFGLRHTRTVVLPYRSDVPLERLYPKGLRTETDVLANPGAEVIEEGDVFPASGSAHLVWRRATQSNLYRIPIPR